MEPIYKIDFPALDIEDKLQLVYNMASQAKASFAEQSFGVSLLAQTLIFTRWWNSYKHMAPNEPTPEILGIVLELLWDFQEGKCSTEEFARFQKSLSASALDIMTGDDSELIEDAESAAFYRRHFGQWKARSYDVFLTNLCTVIEEAAAGKITWRAVEDVVYGDIGDTMINFLEVINRNPTGGGRSPEMVQRDRTIYSTPTFCRVIALLQQDMRAALEGASLAELRARYQTEYLFSPEESAKISDYR